MTNYNEYFDYLSQRSKTGLYYRKYWLYPRLSRFASGRVLDVGCGIGDFLEYCKGAVGVDVNHANVNYCVSQGLNVSQMDVNVLPFEQGSFDTVLLDNVLEHISEPAPLLKEINRVLVPGGNFIVGVPGLIGYHSDDDHKVFYDRKTLQDVVEAHGFKKKKVFGMPLNLEFLGNKMRQYCNYGIFRKESNQML